SSGPFPFYVENYKILNVKKTFRNCTKQRSGSRVISKQRDVLQSIFNEVGLDFNVHNILSCGSDLTGKPINAIASAVSTFFENATLPSFSSDQRLWQFTL